MMRTVSIEAMTALRNEINEHKEKLLYSVTHGFPLPSTNTEKILNKHIDLSVQELKESMPTRVAKKIAKNSLRTVLEDCLAERRV